MRSRGSAPCVTFSSRCGGATAKCTAAAPMSSDAHDALQQPLARIVALALLVLHRVPLAMAGGSRSVISNPASGGSPYLDRLVGSYRAAVLKIHWFLPTGGDPRRPARPRRSAPPRARPRVPRADRDRLRHARLRRDAHAVRHRLRGRLARDRAADPAHAPGQVPRRVPARAALADARRADGVDLPAPLGRAPARQHRDRRRARRARPLRRLGRQGHALRAHRRVRRDHAGRVERRAVRLRRARTTTSSGRDDAHAAGSDPAHLLRRRVRRGRARSRPSTSTCTSRGASRRRWCPSGSTRMRALAAECRPRRSTSASAST